MNDNIQGKRHQRKINIGDKFGNLEVIGFDDDYIKPPYKNCKEIHMYKYLCKCSCGNIVSVREDNLLYKGVISCGCVRINKFIQNNTKHNLSKTRLYKAFHSMHRRCDGKTKCYKRNYKDKNIVVCDQWSKDKNFNGLMNFINWAQNSGYDDSLTLDRIDPNGNYTPDNCRWIPMELQESNKSNNVYIQYQGDNFTCAQWDRALGYPYGTVYSRLKSNTHSTTEEILFGNKNEKIKRNINAIYFIDKYGNTMSEDN